MYGPVNYAKAAALMALATLLILLLGSGRPAYAALQLSVGNPNLQHFDSDGGVQLNFGLTDQDGQPVGNLRPDNIRVFEDGKPAKIVDFRGVGQGRPVDIVFVMDVTQSMQPYIDAIKKNMITFANDLAANNRDYRLGLVTFEDYVVSKYSDCNCPYRYKMTSNVGEFINWVGSLHASGGGDIPEDPLDALAYASTFPFRPEAQAILILITDAPCHVKGDGPDRLGDQAYRDHKNPNADVTDQTGASIAAMLKKQGLTLYAVAPPPFIAPPYQQVVQATHGRLYNIVTEEGRFPELVREIGHSIATEYSLTYRTPRPIEDGTERSVELKIDYNGQAAVAHTSYQVRGIGGAVINVPEEGAGGAGVTTTGTGLTQVSFSWWNAAVPLVAILALIGLSRMRFGVSTEELKAIVEAQSKVPPTIVPAGLRSRGAASSSPSPLRPARPSASAGSAGAAPVAGGPIHEARLLTIDPVDPLPAEYALLKDEISIGRGEDNDIVIPHASVSRAHARLMRRDGAYEVLDLNSTNGSFVDDRQVHGSATVPDGSELRLGDVRFVLRL
jgi:FHA domain/Integrin beta chain VWA domain